MPGLYLAVFDFHALIHRAHHGPNIFRRLLVHFTGELLQFQGNHGPVDQVNFIVFQVSLLWEKPLQFQCFFYFFWAADRASVNALTRGSILSARR
jgi:hypothetical protein